CGARQCPGYHPLDGDPDRPGRRVERQHGVSPDRTSRRTGRGCVPMITRRDFIKTTAATTAAATAGIPLATDAANVVPAPEYTRLKGSKAPCRFCGGGCGVSVAVKDNRVVATHGDMQAEVNRGVNCVKGYFLSKIMYGADRLTQPLLRKKNGQYAKDGEFTPVSWDEAFEVMAQKYKEALRTKGPNSIAMFGSGQWTIWEGYAANKLMKGG